MRSIKHFFRYFLRVEFLIIVNLFFKSVVGPCIQECSSCNAYKDSNGVCRTCTDVYPCPSGYYEVRCTTTADGYCTRCRTSCPAGTYKSLECQSTWDHQCSACQSGYYCPGPFDRYSCDSGTTYSPNWFATACTACKSCPSGQYLSPSCTTTEDTGTCTQCLQYWIVMPR